MINAPASTMMTPYRYAPAPLPGYGPMAGAYPNGVPYPAPWSGSDRQNNNNGDSYGNPQAPMNHPTFMQQHQGACNSMGDACRHYLLDAAPRMMDYAPTATQMGAMWLRNMQDRAMLRQDQADAKPTPRPGADAARALMSNVAEGIGRFFK